MSVFELLTMICGVSLFLFGMNVMSESLQRAAGNQLKNMLRRMTSNPFKGFLLGFVVTAIVQSSSATTVMVVGFVTAGVMSLSQAVGIILGAGLGSTVTGWLTALSGIGGGENDGLLNITAWLKPSTWMPVLAVIGMAMIMFAGRHKKKDIGRIFLGFAVLMTGMDVMSGAVAGLQGDPGFTAMLTMFDNPVLGMLAGLILTAIIQSSAASVAILQSLIAGGVVVTFGRAIPLVMGMCIGTCVTAMLAAISANREGKRAAVVHLYFNIIGTAIGLIVYAILGATVPAVAAFYATVTDLWGVAAIFTGFKLVSVLLLFGFRNQIVRLAVLTVPDKEGEKTVANPLDDHLFASPTVAVERTELETRAMAAMACRSLYDALDLLVTYDEKKAADIRASEARVDVYEDEIGSFLVRLSGQNLDERDSKEVTKLLRLIGDFERISDHAVNLTESAEEMQEKKVVFSPEAQHELSVLSGAVREIVGLCDRAFAEDSPDIAVQIEPLEEWIDRLRDQIKVNHVRRLQKNECSIEHGFVLSDILTNLERVADHCSNVAGCVIEIDEHEALDMHRYLDSVKAGGREFDRMYAAYREKYPL